MKIAYNFEPEYLAEELEELESITMGRDGTVTVDDREEPTQTCMVRFARKFSMNVGSLPLNPSLWISFKMPYLHVVS